MSILISPLSLRIREPEHLSVSQVRTLHQCGYKWAYEHTEAERGYDIGWDNRLRGSVLDDVVSDHFRQKALDGVGLSIQRMQEMAAHSHDEQIDVHKFSMGEAASRDRLMKQVALYRNTFGEHFKPRAIEDVQKNITYFDLELTVPVVGIIDLICDVPMIVDTKIKKRIPKMADVHRDWQLTTYAMMTGITQVALAVVTDENHPKTDLLLSFRNGAQVAAIKAMYNAAWATIKARTFIPAMETMFLCNKQYCPHWDKCPMGENSMLDESMMDVVGLDE